MVAVAGHGMANTVSAWCIRCASKGAALTSSMYRFVIDKFFLRLSPGRLKAGKKAVGADNRQHGCYTNGRFAFSTGSPASPVIGHLLQMAFIVWVVVFAMVVFAKK